MTEPRQIIVTDYDSLVAACRARADALNISRDTIDEIAGLPKGYTSKVLMAKPLGDKSASGGRLSSRNLGRVSLGPILGALGMALQPVEDPEALARVASRMTVRNKAQVRGNTIVSKIIPKWLWNSKRARRAIAKRWENSTPDERRRIARKAWRTRRKRAKKAKIQITQQAGDQDGGRSPGDLRTHHDVGAGA